MTSKAGHTFTAGPWKWTWENVGRDWAIVTDSHGSIVANVNTETGPDAASFPATRKMPAEANAALIAAAPELLAALQWALAELDKSTSYAHPGQFLACDTRARAALSKATAGGAV